MTYKFTNRATNCLKIANKIATELGHNYVGTEHLLYGLANEEAGVASEVLANQNIFAENILEKIEELIGREEANVDTTLGFTPRTKRVIENAFLEARKAGLDEIGTEHLLIGIMKEGDSVAVRILLDLNLNPQKLYNEIVKNFNDKNFEESERNRMGRSGSFNSTPTLNQFGNDLTKIAKERKIRSCNRKKE